MIKKALLALLLALPLMAAAQTTRIGVVNVADIYASMPEMTQARASIETLSRSYDEELSRLKAEFQAKYTEYQALNNDATVSPIIRERRIQELQQMDLKIQSFLVSVTDDIERRESELLLPLIDRVSNAITAVGQADNYTVIYADLSIEAARRPVPGLQPVYLGPTVTDLTPRVKAILGL